MRAFNRHALAILSILIMLITGRVEVDPSTKFSTITIESVDRFLLGHTRLPNESAVIFSILQIYHKPTEKPVRLDPKQALEGIQITELGITNGWFVSNYEYECITTLYKLSYDPKFKTIEIPSSMFQNLPKDILYSMPYKIKDL